MAAHQWAMAPPFTSSLDRTQRRTTVGRTPLDEWSARRRDLYLTTHNTHNRQTSIPSVGFEPAIPAGERPQTYALDRAATWTGLKQCTLLPQLYSSFLASSVISFHCFLSCALCFQFFTPIFLRSFLTSSSHLNLGLTFGLVAYGFHLYMVLATLSLGILSICPNELNLLLLTFWRLTTTIMVVPHP